MSKISKEEFRKAANRSMTSATPALAPHVIVKAGAGTGKTTTMVGGVVKMKGGTPKIKPSKQQAAIWAQIALSSMARSIAMIAFSKEIATTLQARVPAGVDASTTHSRSFKAVLKAFGHLNVNKFRVLDIISEITCEDIYDLRKSRQEFLNGVEELVKHCKMSLCDPTEENLEALAAHYSIELNGSKADVFDMVPQVLERCKDVMADRCIDFNDMIWLPVVLDLPMFKYDLLLVDESQDLNRCQQAIVRKAGRRIILVGDENQAIFGFAGADSESMIRMEQELSETPEGCIVLPLNETRRCSKAIVREAQKIVPDFYAHEDNPEGAIFYAQWDSSHPAAYHQRVQDGDMLVCRVNAPLVSQCLRFIKEGRKAEILGRDAMAGLISLIKKAKTDSVVDLVKFLGDWLNSEQAKENSKRHPSDTRLIALQDKHDTILCFTEGAKTTHDVVEKINSIFVDKAGVNSIRFSSMHKAKGLEAQNIFILEPKGASVPHPMAKSEWALKQEWNLRYVAITRGIETLTYVSEQG